MKGRQLNWLSVNQLQLSDVVLNLPVGSGLKKPKDNTLFLYKNRRTVEMYSNHFLKKRFGNVFELGIGQGGSPPLFAEMFDVDKLVCVDAKESVDDLDQYLKGSENGKRIVPKYGVDQADKDRIQEIVSAEFGSHNLNLVIDDASHFLEETRASFEALFPHLKPNGVYAIEQWRWGNEMKSIWSKEYHGSKIPMSQLIAELTMVCATHPNVINRIIIYPEIVFVVRGNEPLDDGFKIDNYVYLTNPLAMEFSLVDRQKLSRNTSEKIEEEKYNSFIFTHIQKSAGASIRLMIAHTAIANKIPSSKVYNPGVFGVNVEKNLVDVSQDGIDQIKNKDIIVLADHSPFGTERLVGIDSLRNPYRFTILRSPVDRMFSYYYFFLFTGAFPGYKGRHPNSLSDQELNECGESMGNDQVKVLGGATVGEDIPSIEKVTERAVFNLENEFTDFGIYEELDNSIQILKAGLPSWLKVPQDFQFPVTNKSKHSHFRAEIEPRVIEIFSEKCKYDQMLYDYARNLFKEKYS